MKKFLILPLLFILLAGYSYASSPSVDKMFEIMEMDKQINGGFEAMLPMIDQMAVRFNLGPAAKEDLITIYKAWFNEDIDRSGMVKKMKDLYANNFTEKEVKEITEFYQSETGQKYLKKSPELMKLGAQIGMVEAESKQPQLLNRLKPFFEKHNIK